MPMHMVILIIKAYKELNFPSLILLGKMVEEGTPERQIYALLNNAAYFLTSISTLFKHYRTLLPTLND